MKPKSKLHRQILWIRNHLKWITKEEKTYIKEKIFAHWIYTTKKRHVCTACSYEWKNGYHPNSLLVKLNNYICPNCGRKLSQLEGRYRSRKDKAYALKFDTYKNKFQIIRILYVERYLRVGEKAQWYIREVCQHWIREDGKITMLAHGSSGFGSWYSHGPAWNSWSMEVRQNINKFYINDGFYIRGRKIIKIIRRNGYKGSFYNIHPSKFFQLILNRKTKAETLLKMRQFDLLKRVADYNPEDIFIFWPQIKIATRHNYIIEDSKNWFDHMRLLMHFNKDIHNPKYICPDNFNKEHQRFIEKQQKEMEIARVKTLEKQIKKENIYYRRRMKKFLDLIITDGKINIQVMPTVQDIYDEGKELHHCVFSGGYYKNKNEILLSAKKDNKRLETIQFSLETMKIIQSRGLQNESSKYNKKIVNLIQSNVQMIKTAMLNKTKKKEKLKTNICQD